MAESKYLDGGGLTHLWSKIKEYLGTWKTSNFGIGTYNNTGQIDCYNSDLNFINSNLNFINSNISVGNTAVRSYTITRTSGLVVLVSQQGKITIQNDSGLKIYICYLNAEYNGSETNSQLAEVIINNGSSSLIGINNTTAVLMFWFAFDY